MESTLWKIYPTTWGMINILQKASGTMRAVNRGLLPSDAQLAAMTERQFDRECREAFHGER